MGPPYHHWLKVLTPGLSSCINVDKKTRYVPQTKDVLPVIPHDIQSLAA
jgi:hypothetical protein